ncbi:manganese catalase family protein [Patulibacter brassicae]|uniref:Manganese catalase family protein n=1 Tax=Patulibacter brassicae TaxID=1705717 RepID=A0ABU4VJZ8_9ACTN|nr:manganese catalase family protein [Patulibacter brassicae]MDX8152138.1 manganese catalase family protein [Patulibacter brassicae]
MFSHHEELAYTVRVDKPNPVFARLLQQAIGGPEGEMRVMNQYLFQAWGTRGPKRYRDMLLHTGTEEIGHIELLATAVAMNLEGAPSEVVDDVVTNPLVAARMGGMEPRHLLSGGLAAMPSDSNGVPFNAACIDVGGNLVANMHANVAAEAIGRTLAARLREATDDPGMKDMLSFLIARDTMHQQQWLAAAEELNPEHRAAPTDVSDGDPHEQYAHAFFAHADAPVPEDAAWASGEAPDGGRFSVVNAPRLGQEPELAKAPLAIHAGPEATRPDDDGSDPGLLGKAKQAVDQIAGG